MATPGDDRSEQRAEQASADEPVTQGGGVVPPSPESGGWTPGPATSPAWTPEAEPTLAGQDEPPSWFDRTTAPPVPPAPAEPGTPAAVRPPYDDLAESLPQQGSDPGPGDTAPPPAGPPAEGTGWPEWSPPPVSPPSPPGGGSAWSGGAAGVPSPGAGQTPWAADDSGSWSPPGGFPPPPAAGSVPPGGSWSPPEGEAPPGNVSPGSVPPGSVPPGGPPPGAAARPGDPPPGAGPRPGSQGGPGPGGPTSTFPGSPAAKLVADLRRAFPKLTAEPWLVAPGAILVGLAVAWVGSIISAFQSGSAISGRTRIVSFFGPGDLTWAIAILLACTLLVAGQRSASGRAAGFSPTAVHLFGLVIVAGTAVTLAAVIDAIVWLTYLGDAFAVSADELLQRLAAAVIAAAATWWALHADPKRRLG